jgi:hypothetical protein
VGRQTTKRPVLIRPECRKHGALVPDKHLCRTLSGRAIFSPRELSYLGVKVDGPRWLRLDLSPMVLKITCFLHVCRGGGVVRLFSCLASFIPVNRLAKHICREGAHTARPQLLLETAVPSCGTTNGTMHTPTNQGCEYLFGSDSQITRASSANRFLAVAFRLLALSCFLPGLHLDRSAVMRRVGMGGKAYNSLTRWHHLASLGGGGRHPSIQDCLS